LHAFLTFMPLVGLACNVASQMTLSRLPLRLGHVRRQFISFGVGFAATTAGLIALLVSQPLPAPDVVGYMGFDLLSYVFLGFCFFHVINLNISSLRIRILKEYLRHAPAPLPDRVLLDRYNVRDMLDARLERLQSGNQIYLSGARYFAKAGGVSFIGGIFALLRRLLISH
jgi:hypothetical protein